MLPASCFLFPASCFLLPASYFLLIVQVVWSEPGAASTLETDETAASRSGNSGVIGEATGLGYVASRLPLSVPTAKPNPDKPNPKVGVTYS